MSLSLSSIYRVLLWLYASYERRPTARRKSEREIDVERGERLKLYSIKATGCRKERSEREMERQHVKGDEPTSTGYLVYTSTKAR